MPARQDETVHTTANHPWLTADRGWALAGTLRAGERVVRADGSTAVVVSLRVVPGTAPMWDLTVSQVHTFAVGAGQYVVHNCDDTWSKAKTLSNGQTKDQFRAQATTCDFCGRTFRPGEPKIIEHAYPRDQALKYFTKQADYDAFVTDADNLSITCRSCNSAKGTKFPGMFTVPGETLPGFKGGGYVQRLLGRISTMVQRYGLPSSW